MGLKITTDDTLLNHKGDAYILAIDDLKDEDGNAAGTRVTLKIGLKSVENMA